MNNNKKLVVATLAGLALCCTPLAAGIVNLVHDIIAPAPVVVQPTPTVVQTAPVVYQAPTVYQPATTVYQGW